MKDLIKRFLPFIKYCIVGATGTFIDLAALYIFVEYLEFPVLLGATFSFLLAVINNFLLNKLWTFKNKSPNYRKLFIKFLTVALVGLGLTLSSMHLLVNILGLWYMLAKMLSSGIVLTWNFLGNKLWTFKINKKALSIPETFNFELSIIIPAYNECNRIKSTLLIVNDYITTNKLSAEIIVVSDGSTDKTNEIVEEYKKTIRNLQLMSYKINKGKGYAIKQGIEASRGEYILFTDADNSTPIEELKQLLHTLKQNHANLVIGSRYLPNSNIRIKQSKWRFYIGRMGNILISIFLIDGIKDTQCGFKLFTHQAAKEIFSMQKVKRFGFDMEVLVIAKLLGYKIIECPVSWFNSAESRVRPIKDVFITLKDLIYIKLNLWGGRYSSEDPATA